ncbi:hypothetical protein ZIOFF_073336 [Zingiber officinale]|uniref:Uncharacterized protein n=1 Tax=Zingiber officinale TaxID=94328 RepID=A0A8J5C951_ZINOF|nr:hypothetical protein ZIOFF_073336 [Zingiber officinale]
MKKGSDGDAARPAKVRQSRVTDSASHDASPREAKGRSGLRKLRRPVPEGHVPMWVGEEMERFAVPAEVLGRPAFLEPRRTATSRAACSGSPAPFRSSLDYSSSRPPPTPRAKFL